MTTGTDFHAQFFFGRARSPRGATRAMDLRIIVSWMDSFFHDTFSLYKVQQTSLSAGVIGKDANQHVTSDRNFAAFAKPLEYPMPTKGVKA